MSDRCTEGGDNPDPGTTGTPHPPYSDLEGFCRYVAEEMPHQPGCTAIVKENEAKCDCVVRMARVVMGYEVERPDLRVV